MSTRRILAINCDGPGCDATEVTDLAITGERDFRAELREEGWMRKVDPLDFAPRQDFCPKCAVLVDGDLKK